MMGNANLKLNSSYLSQCHEMWELADNTTIRGHCEGKLAHFMHLHVCGIPGDKLTCRVEEMPKMGHFCRFLGEPGSRVRPADPPQLHQGVGPLHEAGTQDAVQGAGTAATTLKSLEELGATALLKTREVIS